MFACSPKFAMCFLVSHDSKILSYPYSSAITPPVLKAVLFLVGEIAEIRAIASARTRDRISLLIKFHPEIQTHPVQDFLNLVERFLAEILRSQHFPFAALDQIANGPDICILQAVVGTY